MKNEQVKDWCPQKPAKALVIGHDPRLQQSDTIAEYAFFADYYFCVKKQNERGGKAKFGLAKSTFEQITHITNGKIQADEIYLTNLCNNSLPHAPKGKTVLIPEDKAKSGIEHIKQIIAENPKIEYIFPMSLQVNYWLQKLSFYSSEKDFVKDTEPKEKGIENAEPYFEPKKSRTFLGICGNIYYVSGNEQIVVIPILHSRCYPLNKRFEAYKPCYDNIQKFFSNHDDQNISSYR